MAVEDVGIRLSLQARRETAKGLQDTAADVREIGTAAEETGRRSSRALSALQGLGSVAVSAAKIGTKALTGLAVAGGAWGLKVASANEQATISFTTMLGSAQQAGHFIKDLQAFAAKTPFDFAGLQDSASTLLSAGIDARKIIPIMTNLGNATSGMGTGAEGVQRATTAIQQMNAAGKISAEDLNQLRDAGIPVYDLLAKATGKSTAAISEMVDKGKLGRKELGQLMDALESGKGLEKFAGLMDAQSASLTGMWSTVKDTVGQGMAGVVQPWVPAIKTALGQATGAATPFFDTLTAKSAELAAKAPAAIDAVRDRLVTGKAAVDGFTAGLRGDGPVAGFTGKLNTLGLGLRALVVAYKEGSVTSDGFVGVMERIGVTVGTTVDRVQASFTSVGTGGAAFTSSLQTVGNTVSVAGVVVGFLADHLDTFAALLPYIAVGLALWKAGQLANTAATLAGIPVRLTEIAATAASASANRALAFQMELQTGIQQQSRLATLGSIAATAAQRLGALASAAAMGVVRGATMAWTGVQWLLNTALLANPIGLVVLGIAALVAGVVVAYNKFQAFRDMVGWVWDKLSGLWNLAQKGGSLLMSLFGGGGGGKSSSAAAIPGRATGGDVGAGEAYVVGERRPELFVPKVDGTIVPRVPTPRRGSGTDGQLADVAAGYTGPDRVVLEVDRKVLAEVTIGGLREKVARQ